MLCLFLYCSSFQDCELQGFFFLCLCSSFGDLGIAFEIAFSAEFEAFCHQLSVMAVWCGIIELAVIVVGPWNLGF